MRLRRLIPAVLAAAFLVAAPVVSLAQVPSGQNKHLPIATGSNDTRMDAPETNNQLEQYAHAPAVARFGSHFGLTPGQSTRVFEDLNAAILFAVILYFLIKIVPGKFRNKRTQLQRDLSDARAATAEAQARLQSVEAKLSMLGTEIEALRHEAAESSARDEARFKKTLEEERSRIVRSAQSEIQAAGEAAERDLKRFASNLAVDRAAERIRLSESGDQALVDDFLSSLAGELGKRGQN